MSNLAARLAKLEERRRPVPHVETKAERDARHRARVEQFRREPHLIAEEKARIAATGDAGRIAAFAALLRIEELRQ